MRSHGWGGSMPANRAEAIERILVATRETVDERGDQTTLADVARALGVTRQTVYSYFGSTEELLWAMAAQNTGPLFDQLTERLHGITDPVEVLVEGMASTVELLPNERYVGLLLRVRHDGKFATSITSPQARNWGRAMFERLDVEWNSVGVGEARLDRLVEICLRTLQSLILDPGDQPRSAADLRSFVREWLGPAVAAAIDRDERSLTNK
ncbi:TetR/AcrR family transcriptional regulator [Aldersonia kunmingensis]|uniref:TetR/AcrR family transcriptional regulator n=1 Tax=Aldersonia kunmingensis TaxID=408066 RepID=UPI00082CBA89|nr:TetR/AcrR family transcriptional regulator [Aldersonia kunmingensis]